LPCWLKWPFKKGRQGYRRRTAVPGSGSGAAARNPFWPLIDSATGGRCLDDAATDGERTTALMNRSRAAKKFEAPEDDFDRCSVAIIVVGVGRRHGVPVSGCATHGEMPPRTSLRHATTMIANAGSDQNRLQGAS